MRYVWALLVLLLVMPMAAPAQKKAKKTPAKMDTVTGCVDEKSDVYILRSDDMLKELATMEPVGFDRTNFARFVGHKVAVSGQLVTTTQPPTIRVSSLDHIKNISDICTP